MVYEKLNVPDDGKSPIFSQKYYTMIIKAYQSCPKLHMSRGPKNMSQKKSRQAHKLMVVESQTSNQSGLW